MSLYFMDNLSSVGKATFWEILRGYLRPVRFATLLLRCISCNCNRFVDVL